MYFAPGYASGPLAINFLSLSKLNLLTVSGKVKFIAIFIGTPTSSMDILGSGVMTERAEKSTLFPMRLPLIRPSLDLRRSVTERRGLPVLCFAGATPGS